MNGRDYPHGLWASENTPRDVLRVMYRNMRADAGAHVATVARWDVNLRACLPRDWRNTEASLMLRPLAELADVVVDGVAEWLRNDLRTLPWEGVTINARRPKNDPTGTVVRLKVTHPAGLMTWEVTQLLIAATYEVSRRVTAWWIMEQVQTALGRAEGEVMIAIANPDLARDRATDAWFRAAQKLAVASATVMWLEALPVPLSGDDLDRYWAAREALDRPFTEWLRPILFDFAREHGDLE